MSEREQQEERYLEAQLREELGLDTDLSERVLREVYAQPVRRVIPPPRRKPVWQPLAAAASVLIVAGLAAFALVKVLPQQNHQEQAESLEPGRDRETQPTQPERGAEPEAPEDISPAKEEPETILDPEPEEQPQPEEQVEKPTSDSEPIKEDESVVDTTPNPEKEDKTEPDGQIGPDPNQPDWTDPSESWPRKNKDTDTTPKARPVLVSSWNGEAIKVNGDRFKHGEAVEIRTGDSVEVKAFADFTLVNGTLLRVDGEITFEGDEKEIAVQLEDGALYADTVAPLRVDGDGISAVVEGMAVVEERLNALDLYCLRGRISVGEDFIAAGFRSRADDDGLGREKAFTWPDVQREFRFLKDVPARALLREDLDEAPGKLFGGELKDGVLGGESDSATGLGFYFRESHTYQEGEVVRFRFRVEKACELILQLGTDENGNWRHKLGGVKPGEWIEFELPLAEFYKTIDVAKSAEPGLRFKFFQLHPEETTTAMEIDWVEIVRKPG